MVFRQDNWDEPTEYSRDPLREYELTTQLTKRNVRLHVLARRSATRRFRFGEKRPRFVYFLPTDTADKEEILGHIADASSELQELSDRIGSRIAPRIWIPTILPPTTTEIAVTKSVARSSKIVSLAETELLLKKCGVEDAHDYLNDGETFRVVRVSGSSYSGIYTECLGPASFKNRFSPQAWFAVFVSRRSPPSLRLPVDGQKQLRTAQAKSLNPRLLFSNNIIQVYRNTDDLADNTPVANEDNDW